jgi:hypothetical protein
LKNAGSEIPEIVVTDEMVEAGVAELTFYDPDRDNGYEFVRRLYQVMAQRTYRGGQQDGHLRQKF